jgi:hypothetical protein
MHLPNIIIKQKQHRYKFWMMLMQVKTNKWKKGFGKIERVENINNESAFFWVKVFLK